MQKRRHGRTEETANNKSLLQVFVERGDNAIDRRLESGLERRTQQNVMVLCGRCQLWCEHARTTDDDRTQTQVSL